MQVVHFFRSGVALSEEGTLSSGKFLLHLHKLLLAWRGWSRGVDGNAISKFGNRDRDVEVECKDGVLSVVMKGGNGGGIQKYKRNSLPNMFRPR